MLRLPVSTRSSIRAASTSAVCRFLTGLSSSGATPRSRAGRRGSNDGAEQRTTRTSGLLSPLSQKATRLNTLRPMRTRFAQLLLVVYVAVIAAGCGGHRTSLGDGSWYGKVVAVDAQRRSVTFAPACGLSDRERWTAAATR